MYPGGTEREKEICLKIHVARVSRNGWERMWLPDVQVASAGKKLDEDRGTRDA